MENGFKERPIIFSGEMVRAILDGRKTQTRRVVTARNSTVLGYTITENDDLWTCLDWMNVRKDSGPHFIHTEASEYLHVNCLNTEYTNTDMAYRVRCRFKVGDRLWVRETWCLVDDTEFGGGKWVDYRATPRYSSEHPAGWENAPDDEMALKWRPSIFMPKWASRIKLEITNIRIERLLDISDADAKAEGVMPMTVLPGDVTSYIGSFCFLWDSINHKKSPWDSNPWVWVIEFKVL